MISAAASWETSGTVTSEMSRPTASAAGQPYSCSAAPFQNSTVPSQVRRDHGVPQRVQQLVGRGRTGSASASIHPACAPLCRWSRGERPGPEGPQRPIGCRLGPVDRYVRGSRDPCRGKEHQARHVGTATPVGRRLRPGGPAPPRLRRQHPRRPARPVGAAPPRPGRPGLPRRHHHLRAASPTGSRGWRRGCAGSASGPATAWPW